MVLAPRVRLPRSQSASSDFLHLVEIDAFVAPEAGVLRDEHRALQVRRDAAVGTS